ncbi:CotH kinase family protein, partial [Ruminococcus bicirculans (ex Wegman et al. 2014)]|uniref:CotH kinase family protein n=1 Tax=Ruminococcus bicirculans (ex Wegman et al. 2014) TaxID=1160721 RepID=UPI00307F0384
MGLKRVSVIGLCLAAVAAVVMLAAVIIRPPKIYISEICPSNSETSEKTAMQDKNGEPSDWIEIYNPTNKDISLTGFSLSKNGGGDQPLGGYVVKAHDYIIVYCSSAGFENADFPHADFSIGKVSEAEIILKYDSLQCESIKLPKLNKGVSYSKNAKGEMYVSEPTPLAANAEKTIGDTPVFSQAAGSYEKAFDLEITAGESQTVYYTTDGTDPATSDTRKVYENALRIDDRSDDENVLSAYDPMKIQLDYRDSIKLPDKSAVDKGTVIRACAEGTSGKCGKTVTATYFVDVSSADHNDLPIVSITTDPDGLFNEKTGIYCLGDVYKEYDEENPDHPWNGSIPANYNQRGREWEKECYVEYFDSEGNSLISQDCGIRIQGGWSRADYQKSFRLYARNDYGKNSFDTVFWDSFTDVNGEAITSCKTFVLRNGGNDANYSKFKDMMIQNMVSGRGVETQQGTACVLFIDGEYWGLYTIQSDYSDRYFADRYNVAKSNVAMYKNDELSEGEAEDEKLFNDMYKFITENDMSIEENYRKACAMIDMDNLVEYAATEMYIFNDD